METDRSPDIELDISRLNAQETQASERPVASFQNLGKNCMLDLRTTRIRRGDRVMISNDIRRGPLRFSDFDVGLSIEHPLAEVARYFLIRARTGQLLAVVAEF